MRILLLAIGLVVLTQCSLESVCSLTNPDKGIGEDHQNDGLPIPDFVPETPEKQFYDESIDNEDLSFFWDDNDKA